MDAQDVGEEEASTRGAEESGEGELGKEGESGKEEFGSDVLLGKAFLDEIKAFIDANPQTDKGPEAAEWLVSTFAILWKQPARNIVQLCRSLPVLRKSLGAMNIVFAKRCEAGFMECVHVAWQLATFYKLSALSKRGLLLNPPVQLLVNLSVWFGTRSTDEYDGARASFGASLFKWTEGPAMDVDGLLTVLGNIALWTTDRESETVYIPDNLIVPNVPTSAIPAIAGELYSYFYKNEVGDYKTDGGHLPTFGLWHAWATRACIVKEESLGTLLHSFCTKYGSVSLRCVLNWFSSPDATENFFICYCDPPRYIDGPKAYALLVSTVQDFITPSEWTAYFLSSSFELPPVQVHRGPVVYTLDVNRDVLKSLQCPISLEAMDHPRITPTGHVFDGPTITEWLKTSGQNPMTRTALTPEDLKSCTILTVLCNTTKNAVAREQHGQCYLSPQTAALFYCANSGNPLTDVVIAPDGKVYNRDTIPASLTPSECVSPPALQTVIDNLVYIYPHDRVEHSIRQSAEIGKNLQEAGNAQEVGSGRPVRTVQKKQKATQSKKQKRWGDSSPYRDRRKRRRDANDMAALPIVHTGGVPGGPELFVMDLTEVSDDDDY